MMLKLNLTVTLLAALLLAGPGLAEDEKCVSQCDAKSDKCMADTNGDEGKEKTCDDSYTECLAQCK